MSRCRACNNILSEKNTRPVYNKFTKLEEDLCTTCIGLSRVTHSQHEYLFGLHPEEGVKVPLSLGAE
ncbi:hypothetical protein phiK7A1_052 [Pseudomonas phage phiK7A1]|uniref:Uncharacterized protein n=1 Tax=Pseudomonas phage phiK7A1 TaxID=2759194 RepID=A0A7H0XFQ2_9CAUD|nr:hypothetical protein phiK7A1_052 [Pseudomonas phage phiK7A1]